MGDAERVAKAVAARRLNSRGEDKIRKTVGFGLGALTVGVLAVSERACHSYGPAALAVGCSVAVWRTGHESL